MSYSMKDLLDASADMLGRSTVGGDYFQGGDHLGVYSSRQEAEERWLSEHGWLQEKNGRARATQAPELGAAAGLFPGQRGTPSRLPLLSLRQSLRALIHGTLGFSPFLVLVLVDKTATKIHVQCIYLSVHPILCRIIRDFRRRKAFSLDGMPQNSPRRGHRASLHPPGPRHNPWKLEIFQCVALSRLRGTPGWRIMVSPHSRIRILLKSWAPVRYSTELPNAETYAFSIKFSNLQTQNFRIFN